MKPIIHLTDEDVRIQVDETDEELAEKYQGSLQGSIAQCIKHVYRYKEFTMPKNLMISILWKAHKGCCCKEDHFDISQRISLYNYFKDKDVDDPYIKQFIKETKEKHKHAIV